MNDDMDTHSQQYDNCDEDNNSEDVLEDLIGSGKTYGEGRKQAGLLSQTLSEVFTSGSHVHNLADNYHRGKQSTRSPQRAGVMHTRTERRQSASEVSNRC
ncbi:hypothetical protein E2C01_074065 [Portunus trituberculatus]|uniref:Uncharacterized protein n=1 Tax=Portunus trituberculatus TaxID=210409 RepID=A0A5B7ICA3_PORTR|nr:hypothetical protein [Portunus trituberculatus]